ncbi:hypothetical protein INT45_005905 [Circinella minor]|uniref:Uncharacterized protein n=1 Tax=Circinella minor TaxID=1195481 RepID=A0A8H7RTF6_9FUNG|nr:hypothetical protein INT45_005905 [Circinella minor]
MANTRGSRKHKRYLSESDEEENMSTENTYNQRQKKQTKYQQLQKNDNDMSSEETYPNQYNEHLLSPSSSSSLNEDTQGVWNQDRTEIKIEKGSLTEQKFLHKAAQDCYKENGFPSSQSQNTYKLALLRAMEAAGKKERSTRMYSIKPDIIQLKYTATIGNRRTGLHNSVLDWLKTYPFNEVNFPIDAINDKGERTPVYYATLLEDDRFLKDGFRTDGAMFFSAGLVDCIRNVMFHPSSGRPRMKKTEPYISKETIALVSTAMFYRIVKLSFRKDKAIFNQDFAVGSDWAKLYQGMLDAEFGPSGLSSITWSKIESYITALVFAGGGLGKQTNVDVMLDLLPSLTPLAKNSDDN